MGGRSSCCRRDNANVAERILAKWRQALSDVDGLDTLNELDRLSDKLEGAEAMPCGDIQLCRKVAQVPDRPGFMERCIGARTYCLVVFVMFVASLYAFWRCGYAQLLHEGDLAAHALWPGPAGEQEDRLHEWPEAWEVVFSGAVAVRQRPSPGGQRLDAKGWNSIVMGRLEPGGEWIKLETEPGYMRVSLPGSEQAILRRSHAEFSEITSGTCKQAGRSSVLDRSSCASAAYMLRGMAEALHVSESPMEPAPDGCYRLGGQFYFSEAAGNWGQGAVPARLRGNASADASAAGARPVCVSRTAA
uniref:Uncharacterized protein n=1 Tax=Zooxanthella nutricula TaxID=1333877 RepID=A0A6U6N612_9DINO